jgi:hypothetical protein
MIQNKGQKLQFSKLKGKNSHSILKLGCSLLQLEFRMKLKGQKYYFQIYKVKISKLYS